MTKAIGIDLGATEIKYALVEKNGNVLFESSMPTEVSAGRDRVLKNLKKVAREALQFALVNEHEVAGVGIGTPGTIDGGLILGGAENFYEWKDLPLGGILGRHLNLPVFVENNENLVGLAEVRYGNGKGDKDVILLTVGASIGGVMILNGNLYGGHRNRGGELAHVIVDVNGEKCFCGETGCLQAHGSVMALIRDYKKLSNIKKAPKHKIIDGSYIVKKYLEKDPAAMKAMNRHFNYLAIGVASFINIFSPQKVIIGGDLAESGKFYIDNIRDRALRIAMKETSVFTKIMRASLGNSAGFLGAASLVIDNTETVVESSHPH